ncbi:NAD(P)/FAD-dependent oxidoreductase [Paraburkholderia sp. CI3]|uniref:NAD(P)/FAD-dependent oxidoreductase n=1 Tax=Paraburkholderia sp. CI3 TaxID=2991060 RepID=UPI003D23B44E
MSAKAMIYDAIVVGAGPGGSSAASFLARDGITTLLIDKSTFPRDKVCGDGLTPQAIYWLDRLGCVNEVLAATDACLKSCDLFINGELVLTGRFPSHTQYPDFAVLLDRKRFDHILLNNACDHGAHFQPDTRVHDIEYEPDCIRVLGETRGKPTEYRARVVIGADGVSSAVSRAIGNTLKDGVIAASLRAYFRNVEWDGAQIKVYFARDYFPGYGWLFVDDSGFANVGLGYAFDKNFPMLENLGAHFRRFLATEVASMLANATRCGQVSGGSAAFYRPKAIIADRVMLIGDAANQADPLNGGGIHKAMESAFCAAQTCRHALDAGDFSCAALKRYETRWNEQYGLDWQTAEIFLSIAKNPNLRDFALFLLKNIGTLTAADPRFQDFASGIFSGVISQSSCLSPLVLYQAFPKQLASWLALMQYDTNAAVAGTHDVVFGSMRLARGAVGSIARAGVDMARSPVTTLDWGIEVATRVVRLAERQVASGHPTSRYGEAAHTSRR